MNDSATTIVQIEETNENEHLAHPLPLWVLFLVWATLIVFTAITVGVADMELGNFNLWAAMIIATIKATLVGLYFMHMRYDKPIIAIVFLSALIFVLLFIGLTAMDTLDYQPDLIPGYAPSIAP